MALALSVDRKELLTSKVCTLWDAREALLDTAGQLLYAGQIIVQNKQLWERVGIVPGRDVAIGVTNDLDDPGFFLSLLDGYFGQGYSYITSHLGEFGNLTLRSGRPLESKFPDFRELIIDPISYGVQELIDRSLSQSRPRQWVTAHFRSRSVVGLGERTQ